MLSLEDRPYSLCDRITRRELMRVGGLNLLGLSFPTLLSAASQAATTPRGATFGRAKNVIYLWLQGGPPQHETFDPKPQAPAEIRGPFRPISTNVPGIHFSELLPRTARIADKLAVVRSLSTDDNVHSSSGYWVLTGNKHTSGNAREIKPSDWPYFGSIVKLLKPSQRVPALSTVWIPDVIRLNENVTPAGQTAGFLGAQWDPDRFIGDPSDENYHIEGLALQDGVSPLRLERRVSLAEQVGRHLSELEQSAATRDFDSIRQAAVGLLTSGGARDAFRVRDEPERVRQRYGKNRWGQCVLLARRLIEAGVRLVHVGWPREPGDSAVTNPMWDTHAQNADRLQDFLCPVFDVGYTALIEDLDARGLLDETLVVAVAEFGRTPKINSSGGRDHWGHVFSFVLAGAGIRGGQVFGSSDRIGGYPASNRVQPPDLNATIFHLLGIDHAATFPDRTGRPLPVTEGEPIRELLGLGPATSARTESTGDVALVPPFDEQQIRNVDFESGAALLPHGTNVRVKHWQASPIVTAHGEHGLGVALVNDPANSRGGLRHAALGFGIGGGSARLSIPQGASAVLSQQVRNPMAGTFTFSVSASGAGASEAYYREVFLRHFACRIEIFAFQDLNKNHAERRPFAVARFKPTWSPAGEARYEPYQVTATLRSQDDGANQTNMGIGVAVIVEKETPGTLDSPDDGPCSAFVRIDDVDLHFDPRQRNNDVVI